MFKAEGLPSNRLGVMRLMAVVHDPDAPTQALEAAISQDVTLSYKLLKLINSAFFALTRKVESISQAIVLLGRRKLASWVSMLALSTLDDRPAEMIRIAMTRAKMCELLAERAGLKSTESFFMVGMFSALDLLMERPLAQLLEPLPLSAALKDALLTGQGEMGEALRCTLAYEQGDWQRVAFAELARAQYTQAYVEAMAWADELMQSL